MVQCQKCGKETPEDSVYCEKCGAKQDIINQKEKTIDSIQTGHSALGNISKGLGKMKVFLIVGGILLVVLLIYVVGFSSKWETSYYNPPSYTPSIDEPDYTSSPSHYCGDGTCNSDESCSSCSTDCGSCYKPPVEKEVTLYTINEFVTNSMTIPFYRIDDYGNGYKEWVYSNYEGGELKITFAAGSLIKYQLLGGRDCVSGLGAVLKEGTITRGTVNWKPSTTEDGLCISLFNLESQTPVNCNIVIQEIKIIS